MCNRLSTIAKPLSGQRGPYPTVFRAHGFAAGVTCLNQDIWLDAIASLSVCLGNRKPHWKVEVLARPQVPL